MPDVAALTAIGSNIKVAFDLGKLILDAKGQLDTAQLTLRLAEMISALAIARMELADVQEELLSKDARIRELESALDARATVVRQYDAYYAMNADGKPTGQPYCMACWER